MVPGFVSAIRSQKVMTMFSSKDFKGIGMTSSRTRMRLIEQLSELGIAEPAILDVMAQIPRHLFLEEGMAHRAYENNALPIGLGQTISQPYIVALMTQVIWQNSPHQKVLEVGTGSGYQTSILSRLWKNVYSIERIRPLFQLAKDRLLKMGLTNIECKAADGFLGWQQQAPFDAIIVTAAASVIPERLVEQLAPGGAMVIPVGMEQQTQQLQLIKKDEKGIKTSQLEAVRFVPMLHGVET